MINRRDEIFNKRINFIENKWKEDKIEFIDDISISYGKLNRIIGSPLYKNVLK